MQVLWSLKEASVKEIIEQLEEPKPEEPSLESSGPKDQRRGSRPPVCHAARTSNDAARLFQLGLGTPARRASLPAEGLHHLTGFSVSAVL